MKIGIITFHWSTNYGAILQSFALQQTLKGMGHDAEIINYKPKKYEPSFYKFVRYRHFLHLKSYLAELKKEKQMMEFRNKYLNCTQRYYTLKELQDNCNSYDLLISGSDQIMNPYFLAAGEKGGSTAYFLDFGKKHTKRITYAVSFGVTEYPQHLIPKVYSLISRFDSLSVRERTGVDILASMGRNDAIVVPDPTILYNAKDYNNFFNVVTRPTDNIVVYMLQDRLSYITKRLPKQNTKIISSESIEDWLASIKNCRHLITNSFHGMVFAILFHRPFTIVLKSIRNEGMNDRFFTLLGRLSLLDRVMKEAEYTINNFKHDWDEIDNKMDEIRAEGIAFIANAVK